MVVTQEISVENMLLTKHLGQGLYSLIYYVWPLDSDFEKPSFCNSSSFMCTKQIFDEHVIKYIKVNTVGKFQYYCIH